MDFCFLKTSQIASIDNFDLKKQKISCFKKANYLIWSEPFSDFQFNFDYQCNMPNGQCLPKTNICSIITLFVQTGHFLFIIFPVVVPMTPLLPANWSIWLSFNSVGYFVFQLELLKKEKKDKYRLSLGFVYIDLLFSRVLWKQLFLNKCHIWFD